jgi:hypothetical protein
MTLKEALETTLSPDSVKNMSNEEFLKIVLDNKIVNDEATLRMLVVEGIQRAFVEGDEFPIKYYDKDEEMPEEAKYVDPGPALTDELVESMKNQ